MVKDQIFSPQGVVKVGRCEISFPTNAKTPF